MINTRREWTLETSTVAELRELVASWDVLEVPGDQVVRVLTRVGMSSDGQLIKRVRVTDK